MFLEMSTNSIMFKCLFNSSIETEFHFKPFSISISQSVVQLGRPKTNKKVVILCKNFFSVASLNKMIQLLDIVAGNFVTHEVDKNGDSETSRTISNLTIQILYFDRH
jgi:hypothetical protein